MQKLFYQTTLGNWLRPICYLGFGRVTLLHEFATIARQNRTCDIGLLV